MLLLVDLFEFIIAAGVAAIILAILSIGASIGLAVGLSLGIIRWFTIRALYRNRLESDWPASKQRQLRYTTTKQIARR